MTLLKEALDPATVVVAVDPGKVSNRIWLSDGTGRRFGTMSGAPGTARLFRAGGGHRG